MIKKLTVRNYKSLKDVTIPLQQLTVLAGPNASGKTNILDALSFVCDLARGKDPLASRGQDFRLLVWGGITDRVSITIAGTFPNGGRDEQGFEYSIEAEAEARYGHLLIQKERCLILANQEVLLERDERSYKVFRRGTQVSGGSAQPYSSVIANCPSNHTELVGIQSLLTDCVFYDFIPWQMKQWQEVRRTTRLEAAGENIAALLHTIQRAESRPYQDILERFRAAMPRVEAIETDLTEERPPKTYVQLREKGIPQPIKSFGISEGTFRILGILLALFSPDPARLVCIEGPETNVHPLLLPTIAEYLKVASKKIQVVVTTHSPHFIDRFQPENLIIVEMKKAATECRPVSTRRDLKELKKALTGMGLGELYYSGELGGVP